METNKLRQVEIIARVGGRQIAYSALDFASYVFGQSLSLHVPHRANADVGDKVELSWRVGQERKVFATLVVYNATKDLQGNLRLACTEPYGRALGKVIPAASWRNATISEIARDILAAAGIRRYDLSDLPAATVSRFSYAEQCAGWVLQTLRHAVLQHLGIHLALMPDLTGELRIGRLADLVPDTGLPLTFASSRDVVSRTSDEVKLHAYPLLYGQTVGIDGAPHFVDAVSMRIKADQSDTRTKVRPL